MRSSSRPELCGADHALRYWPGGLYERLAALVKMAGASDDGHGVGHRDEVGARRAESIVRSSGSPGRALRGSMFGATTTGVCSITLSGPRASGRVLSSTRWITRATSGAPRWRLSSGGLTVRDFSAGLLELWWRGPNDAGSRPLGVRTTQGRGSNAMSYSRSRAVSEARVPLCR